MNGFGYQIRLIEKEDLKGCVIKPGLAVFVLVHF